MKHLVHTTPGKGKQKTRFQDYIPQTEIIRSSNFEGMRKYKGNQSKSFDTSECNSVKYTYSQRQNFVPKLIVDEAPSI